MTSFARILTGVAGIAMIAGVAAPAAAQSTNYGNYQGYNQGGGPVGQVLNSILGGGRYGTYGQGNDRVAVDQCARSAEAQVNSRGRGNAYGAYGNNQQGYAPGYGQQGYNQASMARVVGINAVERRRDGLRISGVIDSGMNRYAGGYGQGYANQGYPNQAYPTPGYPNQGYGNSYAQQAQLADLRFSCRVDFRGYVSNVEIRRNNVAQRRGY